MPATLTPRTDAKKWYRHARDHLVPGMADIHLVLGRGSYEVSAAGATVSLSDGRDLIDFGSYAVTLFGHRPPAVVAAAHHALESMPTSTRLLPNELTTRLAAELVSRVEPDRLTRVWFGSTGSDVVDTALTLAMKATGRTRVLAVEGGFHGKTLGTLPTSSSAGLGSGFEALSRHVERLPVEPDAVARALSSEPAAALLFEPVQGEGGARPLPPEILQRWSRDAKDAGVFVLADEVQCGLHRCGPFSMSVHRELAPDAVLFGKPLGGGVVPLSAAVFCDALFAPFVEDAFLHTSTFSGHPLSCSAGLAALATADGLRSEVPRIEGRLFAHLAALAADHPMFIDETRVVGAFGAIEFRTAECAQLVMIEAARRGLLLCPCISALNVLRVLPPLVATDDEIDRAVDMLAAAIEAATRRVGE